MAHQVETMAYAGEVPWHGLGVPVRPDMTPDQMLEKAGLNWTVERVPQFIKWNGQVRKTGKDVLVRSSDGRILTHISEDWEPVQNQEAFDFFNEFVHAGDMEMHTAGSLRQGNMVWALAKVKESFTVFGKKDKIESYLLFSNPHEYGKCIDIRFTPIRVVCNNTLTLSLNTTSEMMVRLNHRRKFDPEWVKQTLGIASGKLSDYKSMAQFLSGKRYTADNVIDYFKTVFPGSPLKEENEKTVVSMTDAKPKRKRKTRTPDEMSRPARIAHGVLETQPGAEFGAGTWWQAFNAVTFSIDHLLGHKPDTRLNSAWYGANRNRKIKALELAVDFAEAA